MNKLNSSIACGLALLTLGTSLAPVTNVFANDIKPTNLTKRTSTSEYKLNQLAKEYKGVSLAEVNFDKSKMNEKQLDLYNRLLDIQYIQATEQGTTEGLTRSAYIFKLDHKIQGSNIQPRNGGHGLISVKDLGHTFNLMINSALIFTGFGSIEVMVKSIGKQAAKKIIEENILPAVINQSKSMGLRGVALYLGGDFVSTLLDNFFSPGLGIAKGIDSIDKIPNNGWIELT